MKRVVSHHLRNDIHFSVEIICIVITMFHCRYIGPVGTVTDSGTQESTLNTPTHAWVSTFAGSGTAGSKNGPVEEAQFNNPHDIVLGPAGEVYVADLKNHQIRVIRNGMVSTLAGSGKAGYQDGPSATAQFNEPRGLVVDQKGQVIVADSENQRLRIISNGMVSTLAGTGAKGDLDGPATSAQFNLPYGLAIDESGAIYIADKGNNKIRRLANGVVSTLAGTGEGGFLDGEATSAQFKSPYRLALGAQQGQLYIADRDNHRIRLLANNMVSTIAGSESGFLDGLVSLALFKAPHGVAVTANGTIYVADSQNNRIRKIEEGVVSTVCGTSVAGFEDGPSNQAQFNYPYDIAIGKSNRIYVADHLNNRIRLCFP